MEDKRPTLGGKPIGVDIEFTSNTRFYNLFNEFAHELSFVAAQYLEQQDFVLELPRKTRQVLLQAIEHDFNTSGFVVKDGPPLYEFEGDVTIRLPNRSQIILKVKQ